jgi:hypothetical protein
MSCVEKGKANFSLIIHEINFRKKNYLITLNIPEYARQSSALALQLNIY